MSTHFYIGIDGGGTQSKLRLEDQSGQVLAQTTSGPANIRLSVTDAWQSIYQGIHTILPQGISLRDPQYQFHVGMGLAGCEVIEAYQEFLNQPHPFATLKMTSDAHIACIGAHKANAGAIIIIGTGVVGYQLEGQHNTQVGGWGFPHDDLGGGAWLGLQAVSLTLQSLDHRIASSPLYRDIFAYFQNNQERMVTWANRATSSDFASLAPIVVQYSQQQESTAIQLLKQAAKMIDNIGLALEKQQQTQSILPCCLLGGLASFIEPWVDARLKERLVVPKNDACSGAIFMVRA